jgi:hypothetical protein
MTRLEFGERLIKNLKREIAEESTAYMSKENAYLALKNCTGQDFGYDADKMAEMG